MPDIITIRVPGDLKYIHFINDAAELLFKEHIDFYAEELMMLFVQDMRIVMYELFANAVFNSKCESVSVEFTLGEEWLTINVRTKYTPYVIHPVSSNGETPATFAPPYTKEIIGNEILVYADAENQVYCEVVSERKLEFHNRRTSRRQLGYNELPEHYGINLITKFSHKATYTNEADGCDCFTVKRKIR